MIILNLLKMMWNGVEYMDWCLDKVFIKNSFLFFLLLCWEFERRKNVNWIFV